MGRITVFAIDGCPHCIRAKKALTERKIPYEEINLTSYPDKRSDMLSLSNSLTVPQVFFNDSHIEEGAAGLFSLLKRWDEEEINGGPSAYEKVESDVLSKPDPTDSRLKPSTMLPVKEHIPPPRNQNDNIILPSITGGGVASVLDITARLVSAVPQRNLSYIGKTYKKAITGKDLTETLMKEFSITREEAISFGLHLQQRDVVHHVTYDHTFSDSKSLFFRLQPYQTPWILNSFRIWTDRVDPNYIATVSRLNKAMENMQNRATDKNGNVDLTAVSKDGEYATFEEEVCELQGVDLSKMDASTKTAFVINTYNLMIKYAQIKVGVPNTNFERASFFTQVMMNIGGKMFSFNDLENGILRANSKAPYALRKTFKNKDDRSKLSLAIVDNRIHFALNCGAKSCPPVKKFTSKDLDEELRIVALSFCEQDDNVKVLPKQNEVHLSTIFKWYLPDFAFSVGDLPSILIKFLRGDKKEKLSNMVDGNQAIKVKFMVYDWSSNVTNVGKFNSSILRPDETIVDYFCKIC